MEPTKPKLGRPYGAKYTPGIRVCLPPEVESALRGAKRLTGVTISEMIRLGVLAVLGSTEAIAVDRIESKKASAPTKLRMIDYLRGLAKARLAMLEPDKAELLREADRVELVTRLQDAKRAHHSSSSPLGPVEVQS